MRTLQEKYNAIQEGKFSKDQFLVEARMQQPQLVTRYNGYKDAVQILKNRGMIKESSAEESFADYSNDALSDMIINMSRYEGNEEEITRIKSELQRREETLNEANLGHNEISSIHQEGGSWIVTYRKDGTKEKVFKTEKEARAFEKTLNEAKLTKKSLTDYRYKPTNDMDKYPYEQILRGLRVELETMSVQGTPTPEEYSKALAKVSKNLAKDSIFYTNQLAGHNKKVDLHDKFVDSTAKNTVDTFNGMKKIKDLKESHTGNPKDKYVVRPCKNKKEPWAVWEGEERVKGFATKEQAKEYADKQNKKQGLSESVLKEGIKNLIKKALMENEEDVYEMYAEEDEIDYDDENFSDPFIDDPDFQFESTATEGQTVTFTNTNDGNKYTGTVVKDLGNGRFTFRAEDGKVYGSEGFGRNWKIKFEADGEDMFESVSLKDIL